MGTIAASVITNKASEQLHDIEQARWTGVELLYWLNEGQRAIVVLRPEANIVNGAVQLVAGTKQEIPTKGIRLHKVVRNMGLTGSYPGKVVKLVDVSILDSYSPDWHTEDSNAAPDNYVFDGNNPKIFYVSPPQPDIDRGYVEIAYSAEPTECATAADVIDISDIWQAALLDYVMFRAFSKDSDYASKNGAAANMYQLFLNSMGLKKAVDADVSPNKNTPPYNQQPSEKK